MKNLVQDEAKRLNGLLQKALSSFEILSHLTTNPKSEEGDNFDIVKDDDDLINLYATDEATTESIRLLYSCENKLKWIENTSQLFDSKDISLLRRTHKHTISVCEHLLPIKDAFLERSGAVEATSPEYAAFLALFSDFCVQTYAFTNSAVEDIDEKVAFVGDLTDKIRLLEESKRTLGIRLKTAKERKNKVESDLSSKIESLTVELKSLTMVFILFI